MTPPSLSVVVALISGKRSDLHGCLRALSTQQGDVSTEILVPYDDPCADVTELSTEFPRIRFLHAAGLDSAHARRGGSREHHDALRTMGLRAAHAEIVALTEDHAHAADTWCLELLAALERHPRAAAVGGAVECDSDRLLNWAVWFCDFGRYQNPLPEGASEFVSDSNVAYRRSALERVAAAWADDYHETAVHWAMIDGGFDLCTTPRVVVWQARSGLDLPRALRERYVWARSFAGTRARLTPGSRRWALALLSPALPLVMTWRVFDTTRRRGRHTSRFFRALPLVLLLQLFWAAGEFVGYVTGRPR
jgi:glycosyl transferase family 2